MEDPQRGAAEWEGVASGLPARGGYGGAGGDGRLGGDTKLAKVHHGGNH